MGICVQVANEFWEDLSPRLKNLLLTYDEIKSVGTRKLDHKSYLSVSKNILNLCLEEKQYLIYLRVLYEIIHTNRIRGGVNITIQLANAFLSSGDEIINRSLLEFPNYTSYAESNYLFILAEICYLYTLSHQVNDERLDKFFNLHEECINKWGDEEFEREFLLSKITLELMKGNLESATQHYKLRSSLPVPSYECYACSLMSDLEYLIASEQFNKVNDIINNLIAGNTPSDYEPCDSTTPYMLYYEAILCSIRYNKLDYIKEIIPLFNESALNTNKDFNNITSISFSLQNDYTYIDKSLDGFTEYIDDLNSLDVPFSSLEDTLIWYIYFSRLYNSGVKNISLNLNEPLFENKGNLYDVQAIIEYLEKEADIIGNKFDKSRKNFNYAKRKETCNRLIKY